MQVPQPGAGQIWGGGESPRYRFLLRLPIVPRTPRLPSATRAPGCGLARVQMRETDGERGVDGNRNELSYYKRCERWAGIDLHRHSYLLI